MGDRAVYSEVIQAMKKARDRADNASDSDTSISKPTNRGNKLKRKARYISKGPLRQFDKLRTPKEKIVYNGYEREIISRNPPRVDADGDVVDNPDDEEDAELTDADENPYRDVKIEEILRPLTSAGDLHKHPSLAEPYQSKCVEEMIEQARNMMFLEQQKLNKMQGFMTILIGDTSYVPLGSLETDDDLAIISAPLQTSETAASSSVASGVAGASENAQSMAGTEPHTNGQAREDADMEDADDHAPSEAPANVSEHKEAWPEPGQSVPTDHDMADAPGPAASPHDPGDPAAEGHDPLDDDGADADDDEEAQVSHRMTTRSRAAPLPSSSRGASPSSTPRLLVHPLYTLPEARLPAPPAGFLAQRTLYQDLLRQVSSYVQKQQEVVRQCAELHASLLRAQRHRDTVWQWCRAEGHVGEMSDGEDWIDEAQWGLDEYPKKGEEVEDEEEVGAQRRHVRQPRRAGAGAKA